MFARLLASPRWNVAKPISVKLCLGRYFSVEADYKTEISDILSGYEEKKKRRQSMIGIIVSVKCAKSIVVRIPREKFISKYNKTITHHTRVMAHDADETGKLGDLVRIVPCAPVSKKKRHSLIDIIRRPQSVTLTEAEAAL
ncbi:hypothetical protein B484DRAFT_428210 [Ochromonadaceae sp. CCMP2298]|nr:hypothetical protein B484DRAFT_428210 [Ochromonadaceae sp. CCMP2298]|mmetsp:Transcript_9120/g.20094  ORF Transcript_9120/g.20094 Transcript_9120/m.20094 type:complete len:141 (+) Transcript_9120:141-563(+)|eukprot:CAMPEP_0173195434 /NCGR_PEP_ID=MMETSP1141-20130122/15051_1 /TAXON_ID=483371 /ORGANISM="non described non described, Strain CCMP2298" /LENGTH=140 /DNA_ID=CAMNT_0014119959 /DNA_START=88 /DNA_END=510 /DNA_ORIENTATION=+